MKNVLDISDRSSVESRLAGALKNTIYAHGPITKDWVASAAKRMYGQLKGMAREQHRREKNEDLYRLPRSKNNS